MAERKVGIHIVAKDLASGTLVKIGKGSVVAGSGVAKLARSIANTSLNLEKMGARWGMITGLISAATDAIRRLALGHIDAAMEFRNSTDPMRRWYDDQQKNVELVSARIGDVWLPVLKGLSDAVDEVTGSISGWIAANRKMLAMELIEYFRPLGKIIGGIVKMVGLLRQGFVGLEVAFLAISQAWWGVVNVFAGGAHRILGAVADIASALGQDGMLPKIWEAQGALVTMGKSAGDSGEAAVESMFALQGAIDGIQTSTERAVAGVDRVTERAIVLSKRALDADKAAGETRVRAEIEASDEIERRRLALYVRLRAKQRELLKQEQEAAKQRKIQASELTMTWSSAFMDTAASSIAAGRSIENAMGDAARGMIASILGSVRSAVLAYAAQAAAAAFAANAMIPGIGIAVGAAAAATALSAVQAYVPKMALGGDIRGGIPGRDTVPILAMPGERVLTPTQTRRMDERERRGGGDVPPIHLVINVTQQSLTPDAELAKRAALVLAPALEQAARDGQLRLAGA